MTPGECRFGALLEGGACRFTLWAPFHEKVSVRLFGARSRVVPLRRSDSGVFTGAIPDVQPDTEYVYRVDGKERPDPASRLQPHGVHGPSVVLDPTFAWTDGEFAPKPLRDAVIYELHVGTFTGPGTFDAAAERLEELRDLGVTHVELMPIAQFPGDRNWGYDGVYPHAVHAGYGGPAGLHRFVEACHSAGLGVILDVVYNHLGPEGNYLREFGPYFTSAHRTPWGDALNFDGAHSGWVRRYFIQSAEYFVESFHVDGFRLDAIHAIIDASANPFLRQFTEAVHRRADTLGRRVLVIAESDLNDVRAIQMRDTGGYGMDGQWSDDFHHSLHSLLTKERTGYYQDFGELSDLASAYRSGYVYGGRYSRFRMRPHGNSASGYPGERFVVCTQNHDQVGNRARGDRLSERLSFAEQKLAACLLLVSPYVPLLFMGQEYGETAPFQYFTSHSDPALSASVSDGRAREFEAFGWKAEDIPDPQDEQTFLRSKLNRVERRTAHGVLLFRLHQTLLRLRRECPALGAGDPAEVECTADDRARSLVLRRRSASADCVIAFTFEKPAEIYLPLIEGTWSRLLDTEHGEWGGSGRHETPARVQNGGIAVRLPAHCCVIFEASAEQPALS